MKDKMRLLFKKTFKQFAYSLGGGLFGIANKFVSNKSLTVFVFHDVTDEPSEFSSLYHLNVTPRLFDFQIQFIKKNFNIIGPDDFLQSKIPPKAALITFDDGFSNYFTHAVPILRRHEVPSIIFLNMEPIKGAVFWSGLITYLCEKRKDFKDYLKSSLQIRTSKKPLFLYCSRDVVGSYIKRTGDSFEKEVSRFVGEFATEKDIMEASTSPFIFYGNHLYNHDVPLLLSDEALLCSYFKNVEELKKYTNYRDMFSFPFGQPGTCYSDEQVNLLLRSGAKKIFSTNGLVNHDVSSSYLHRIPLDSFNDSAAKIWFQICRNSFRKNKHDCLKGVNEDRNNNC